MAYNKGNTKHGMYGTKTYNTWHSMKKRCKNKSEASFKHYGERGITVCEKWLTFEGFYEDMGDRPDGMTLDRIDNNKGYFKDNCRWASKTTQSSNKRTFKNNKLGIKGVFFHKASNKFAAHISIKGNQKHLGVYDTLEEAREVRLKAEKKYYNV
jgi:hypothetical protein